MVKTYDSYYEAVKHKAGNETVCGTYATDGTPVYFVAPRAATEMDLRRIAFEIREKRPMSPFEHSLLKLAESGVT